MASDAGAIGGGAVARHACAMTASGLAATGWCKGDPVLAEADSGWPGVLSMRLGPVLGGDNMGTGDAVGVLQREKSSGKLQLAGLRREEERETGRETGSEAEVRALP